MEFEKQLVENSFYLKKIKKTYQLNKLTWQVLVQNQNSTCVCLNENSEISQVYFLNPDDKFGFKRIEVWGYGKIIPFVLVVYPFINNKLDESCKQTYKFFTTDNPNYCFYHGSNFFNVNSLLIKIYE